MSGSPRQLSDPEIVDLLNIDRDFDMRTVLDRSGYPPIKFKSQTWRAQSHIAFPPKSSSPDATSDGHRTPRRLCRGGKIYVAGTGGSGSGEDCTERL